MFIISINNNIDYDNNINNLVINYDTDTIAIHNIIVIINDLGIGNGNDDITYIDNE